MLKRFAALCIHRTFTLIFACYYQAYLFLESDMVKVESELDKQSALSPEKLHEREMKETIKNEWHKTPENQEKLIHLLKLAFGNHYSYLIAHHIVIQKPGEQDSLEIPSAETLFFDHDFLMGLSMCVFKSSSEIAQEIAYLDKQARLDYLYNLTTNER